MEISLQKVSARDGKDRFVLVNQKTGQQVSKGDASEKTIRKYLLSMGEAEKLIDECIRKARKRFEKSQANGNGEEDLDEIFAEFELDENAEAE